MSKIEIDVSNQFLEELTSKKLDALEKENKKLKRINSNLMTKVDAYEAESLKMQKLWEQLDQLLQTLNSLGVY